MPTWVGPFLPSTDTMALLAMDLFWGQLARAVDNWQLLLALVLLCAPTATFLVTSLISYYQSVSKSAGSEPPLNPYWIPFLGSWVTFPTKKQEWFKLARYVGHDRKE